MSSTGWAAEFSRATPPTLDRLARVLPGYGAKFDVTLAAARDAIGPVCDPSDAAHAAALRVWLNKWVCRIRYPRMGEPDVFVETLAAWWREFQPALRQVRHSLPRATEQELIALAAAYANLEHRAAAANQRSVRRFGPTATAKILYFLKPDAVTAWDYAIARHVRRTPDSRDVPFLAHLYVCREWGRELVNEAAARGIAEAEIGPSLGRPLSSVAKLIDEWLYQTITQRVPAE